MSGRRDRPREARRLHAGRLLRRLRRALSRHPDLQRQGRRAPGRRLHAQLDRRRGHRRHLAVRRPRRRHRLDLRRLVILRSISFNLPSSSTCRHCCSRCSRAWSCWLAVSLGAARVFRMRNRLRAVRADRMLRRSADPIDRPIVIASLFVLVILVLRLGLHPCDPGQPRFLRPSYLLQQLQVGAFLGIVAAGMMLVILLGHIDLSVPWTMAVGGMMATAVGGGGRSARRWRCRRHRPRPDRRHLQRHRRRLSARPVDDLHARRQRDAARPDGDAHRRLRAAGPRHPTACSSSPPSARPRHPECALIVWCLVGVGDGLPAAAHAVRPLHLRDRQSRGRGLPVRRPHPRRAGRGASRSCGMLLRARRRAARRLLDQGLPGHGRRLPAAVDRRRGDRRHPHPGRPRPLRRHGRRRRS